MPFRSIRLVLTLVAAVVAGVAAAYLMPQPLPELTRAELLDEIQSGHVRRVEIEDQDIILGESSTRGAFRSGFDRKHDGGLPDELRALGVEVWFSKSPPGI